MPRGEGADTRGNNNRGQPSSVHVYIYIYIFAKKKKHARTHIKNALFCSENNNEKPTNFSIDCSCLSRNERALRRAPRLFPVGQVRSRSCHFYTVKLRLLFISKRARIYLYPYIYTFAYCFVIFFFLSGDKVHARRRV